MDTGTDVWDHANRKLRLEGPPMERQQLDLYFDYISPYAYLGWRNARSRCAKQHIELVLHPVLLAGFLSHWGQLGPAEIAPKREFVIRDTLRTAAKSGVPLTYPATHPFRPLTALRLSQARVAGDQQAQVVEILWRTGWEIGGDLGSDDVLLRALNDGGLDGAALLARASATEGKTALRETTESAIARGVFGVPTFFVADELFWGNDRLDDVFDALAGKNVLDPERAREMLSRPVGAKRSGGSSS